MIKTEKDDNVSPAAAPGTPRFTHSEKSLLYKLFQENEDVIDIKFRKVSRQKMSIREAWEKIVNSYNDSPGITTKRNFKQIQKFWLNARLRKQYPSKNNVEPISTTMIKQEKGLDIKQMELPKVQKHCGDMEMEEDLIEEDHEYEEEEIIMPTRSVNAQTEYVEVNNHQQTYSQIPTQQISVDQISADKLTLNDLLQFKSSRPSDQDIILQIKEQPHTHTKLQIANIQNNAVTASTSSNAPNIVQQQETPIHSYYTTTTQNLDYQFDVNYFKTKEAELKFKDDQLQFEKRKLDLARTQQELEHMKVIHALEVEKKKLEIRILQETLKKK
ncbi:z family protein [Megaselia abdita]